MILRVLLLAMAPLSLMAHEQFYVTTHSGHNIAIYDTSGNSIGNALDTSTITAGGALKEMRDVRIGPDGFLYVANSSIDSSVSGAGSLASSILRFSWGGSQWSFRDNFSTVISTSTLSHPFSMTFSAGLTPNIYVSTQDGGKPVGFSTSGLDSPQSLSTLFTMGASDTPRQIAFGPDGTLYLANEGTGSVQKYDASGALLGNFTSGYALQSPSHFSFYNGSLYVNSPDENKIIRFDGITGAFQDEFIHDSHLNKPSGFAFDEAGVFYVANRTSDGKILKYHVDEDGTASYDSHIVTGIDQPEFIYFIPDQYTVPEPSAFLLIAFAGVAIMAVAFRRRVADT